MTKTEFDKGLRWVSSIVDSLVGVRTRQRWQLSLMTPDEFEKMLTEDALLIKSVFTAVFGDVLGDEKKEQLEKRVQETLKQAMAEMFPGYYQ